MATQQITRALGALELLCAHPAGLPLQAVADALDMPKSAAHRTLAELAALGHVRQDPDTARYLLTTRLLSLAFGFLGQSGLNDVVQPILDRLAEVSGELVRLGVIDGDRQVWVTKSQGARSGMRYDPDMGRGAALSCTASGHAWLASLPGDDALALLAREGIASHDGLGSQAPKTLQDVMALVQKARARGYAWVVDSSAPGLAALAVAVLHPVTGAVIGTVSVAGPSLRLTEARLPVVSPALLAAARELGFASSGSSFFAARGSAR
ncbi:IclR family transcriptional regulator [Piscinibacter gummiphilus]|uniref:IclR family transcriptional regulator n=1 Tax=Piscinibacter gummiphilus TaxID=946333 RepID=A0A1W6L859_9BURK|nr:IclR family transcriptional regulator [Piscinibacter gummiphilus]ARN20521.1 IclR family transcriptional regulator [Piscinibacter gummiphilus]ATU65197.1 IclR family transcriptional regulator [Piscinibacter gummiphilus]GLS98403.1 transcriptional regulator [Piscinibacter gummiphilus]